MRSFQLTYLAGMYLGRTEALVGDHPYPWLVWEPGDWTPIVPGGTVVVRTAQLNRSPGASGLAIALNAPKGGKLTLGRSAGCELSLHDGTLSDRHLVFRRSAIDQWQWTVADLAGKGSSWVEAVPLGAGQPRLLANGMRLQAGKVMLTFYLPESLLARLQGK